MCHHDQSRYRNILAYSCVGSNVALVLATHPKSGVALVHRLAYITPVNAPLYNTEILRLAATIPFSERLAEPMASSEKRSPICGSRVTVDVNVDADGRIVEIGMLVRACALGQASASLMAAHAVGRTPAELAAARDALTAWLAGERATPPDWPGMEIFAPALPHSARHPSIRLGFEAVAEAASAAGSR
jgi:NifU-like protein involved in Fe-S cluster formation